MSAQGGKLPVGPYEEYEKYETRATPQSARTRASVKRWPGANVGCAGGRGMRHTNQSWASQAGLTQPGRPRHATQTGTLARSIAPNQACSPAPPHLLQR
eukprot:364751-Chlamydomonas_euryale.AAC.5